MIQTKAYLLPLIIAILIWYISRQLRIFLNHYKFIRKNTPLWLQNTMVFVLMFIILAFISQLLSTSLAEFSTRIDHYENNIQKFNAQIIKDYQFNFIEVINTNIGNIKLSSILHPVVNGLTAFLSDGFLILMFIIFIVLEENIFIQKFRLLFPTEDKLETFQILIKKIDRSFSRYISLKTLVGLLTAVLSYLVLLILGVSSPILWAFIIFLLNYIPSVGSLIATAFPTLVAFLEQGQLIDGVYVLIALGAVQIVVGNIIEPKIMGNSLNISPFVVIVALVIFGAIWGIMGTVLSVPITVMLIIIFSQFESTKPIAILLSETGKIGDSTPVNQNENAD